MWRWSYAINADENDDNVFSTYVEMILKEGGQKGDKDSVLHVCGDDPLQVVEQM